MNVAKINRYFRRLPTGDFKYSVDIQNKIFDEKVADLDELAIVLVEKATEASINEGAKRVAGSFFFGNSQFFLETSVGNEGKYKKTNRNYYWIIYRNYPYCNTEPVFTIH